MSATPPRTRTHFRGKPRPGRIVPAQVRAGADGPWLAGETRNLGVGGAFVALASDLPVGAAITLALALPGRAAPLALPAVVRWRRAGDEPGVGVQFVGAEVDALLELDGYLVAQPPG